MAKKKVFSNKALKQFAPDPWVAAGLAKTPKLQPKKARRAGQTAYRPVEKPKSSVFSLKPGQKKTPAVKSSGSLKHGSWRPKNPGPSIRTAQSLLLDLARKGKAGYESPEVAKGKRLFEAPPRGQGRESAAARGKRLFEAPAQDKHGRASSIRRATQSIIGPLKEFAKTPSTGSPEANWNNAKRTADTRRRVGARRAPGGQTRGRVPLSDVEPSYKGSPEIKHTKKGKARATGAEKARLNDFNRFNYEQRTNESVVNDPEGSFKKTPEIEPEPVHEAKKVDRNEYRPSPKTKSELTQESIDRESIKKLGLDPDKPREIAEFREPETTRRSKRKTDAELKQEQINRARKHVSQHGEKIDVHRQSSDKARAEAQQRGAEKRARNAKKEMLRAARDKAGSSKPSPKPKSVPVPKVKSPNWDPPSNRAGMPTSGLTRKRYVALRNESVARGSGPGGLNEPPKTQVPRPTNVRWLDKTSPHTAAWKDPAKPVVEFPSPKRGTPGKSRQKYQFPAGGKKIGETWVPKVEETPRAKMATSEQQKAKIEKRNSPTRRPAPRVQNRPPSPDKQLDKANEAINKAGRERNAKAQGKAPGVKGVIKGAAKALGPVGAVVSLAMGADIAEAAGFQVDSAGSPDANPRDRKNWYYKDHPKERARDLAQLKKRDKAKQVAKSEENARRSGSQFRSGTFNVTAGSKAPVRKKK
jgi:hypothetical protein